MPGDSAQGAGFRWVSQAREAQPPDVPQDRRARMAGSWEGRRDEDYFGAGAAGADDVRTGMGGCGEEVFAGADAARPAAGAKMSTGMRAGGAEIPGYHKRNAALPAEFGDGAAEGQAIGGGIVTVHHAGNAGR